MSQFNKLSRSMTIKTENDDYYRSSASKSGSDPAWRRFLGNTFRRRWLLWLSDKIKAKSRTPARFEDGFRDNLLRPHLFGVAVRRNDGLDGRSL